MAASPEQRKQYQVVKAFKALNTKANRTAIADEEFSWIENVQPIGFGNLKVVNSQGANVGTFSNTVTTLTNFNVNNTDYVAAFETNGGAEVYNLTSNSVTTMANASTFSAANVRARQWKDDRAIILDPLKGYSTWDGTNLVTVGCIGPIGITNAGTNYTTVPTVTISAPNQTGGEQATALAAISNAAGTIISAQVTTPGSGYISVPTVTVAPPSSTFGVQAQATATISGGSIVAINIVNPGLGYTSAPTITISAPQVSNVSIVSVSRTNNIATITTSAAHNLYTGNFVTINVTTNTGLNATNVSVTNLISATSFSYVSNGANIASTSDTGTVTYIAASASANLGSGLISSIAITNPGSGYTATPTVTISGGGGNNATAVAGFVTFATGSIGVLVTNGGTGYTSTPTVNISAAPGGGTNATATAIVNGGTVTNIIVTNPGAGYTSTPTVSITGGGGSNATATAVLTSNQNVDIASFQGRVWIAQGRTVFYSAAGTYNDFVTVSAGNLELTDDTLHTNITALMSANNFLYVFGDDSINVFSDVRVGTTGLTQFTNTNVSASVGSKRINAIFPYFRSLLFMNDYGVYALVGATTTKLSDSLDGIFPDIDFTQPVSAGEVLINNILCAAFNFTYNDPVQGARPIQAVFFDKKWFITSQGTVQYMTSLPTAGGVYLWATDGTNLYRLYSNSTANVSSMVQTALWPLTDVIRDKQALKFGVEATTTTTVTLNLTVDSQSNVSPVYTLGNFVEWINNVSVPIPWVNNSAQTVAWIGGTGYVLYKSDAQQYGKYLGYTVTSTSPSFTYNTFEMEYELRARF